MERETSTPDADGSGFEWLTTEHIEAARSVVAEIREAHDVELALVSGSLAFGLGHGQSDIDVYLMVKGDLSTMQRVYKRGPYDVQINLMDAVMIDSAVEWSRAHTRNMSGGRRAGHVDQMLLKHAVRLTRGELLHASAAVTELLDGLDVDGMRRQLISSGALGVGRALEDAFGTLQVNDFDTAFLSARIALTEACEAILAACGDLYLGPKFLMRRVARTAQLTPVRRLIRAGFDMPSERSFDSGIEELVRARCALAGYLVSVAVLDGWNDVISAPVAYTSGERGPNRDAFHHLNRFNDGVGMAGPDRGFRLSQEAARLWLELDGTRNLEEIASVRTAAEVQGIDKYLAIGAAQ